MQGYIWKIIIAEMVAKIFIQRYFESHFSNTILISFTKNPAIAETLFLPTINSFLLNFLWYSVLMSLITIPSTAIILYLCVKQYQSSSLAKVLTYVYTFFLISSIFSFVSDVANYQAKGKVHLFSKGNYFFNKALIQNAKESGDYKFINAIVNGTAIGNEELLDIINRRPKEEVLKLNKEESVKITAKSGKIKKCRLDKGVGHVVLYVDSGECMFFNSKKLKGESNITILDEDVESKVVIYSL